MKPEEVRQAITNQIIEALQSDLPPWRCPWSCDPNAGQPANLTSKKSYRGINPLVLQCAAMKKGFRSKWWATFNQWREADCCVQKGQKGTQIIFFRPVSKTSKTEDGDEKNEKFLVMKTFTVFNAEQCGGEVAPYLVGSGEGTRPDPDFDAAERAVAATGADIRHGGNDACYVPAEDVIYLPHRDQFGGLADYFETAFHELCHFSEHPTRLNWDRPNGGYALGELRAEIGACYVAGELGLPNSQDLTRHASYVKHWLKGMKSDPKFVFQAAAQASKAADFILSFSRSPANVEPLVVV